MVNYKPYATKYLTIGEVTIPLKNEWNLKTLNQIKAPTTAGVSHVDETGSAYQVPTGKTFTILGFYVVEWTANMIGTIYQSDAEDASTNPVTKFSQYSSTTSQIYTVAPLQPLTIVAEKYINVKTNSSTKFMYFPIIYGYET